MSGHPPTNEPKYFIDQKGTLVVDKDWVEVVGDIRAYCDEYFLPGDVGELLYLEVKDFNWRLEGRKIVLNERPKSYVAGAIVIHYRSRGE